MKRNLAALEGDTFDLLVIGGGIQGAFAAWDAVTRGLSVALVEKADFGAATSANSLKTIHGGIRHLQGAEFGRLRQSIRERSLLMRVAPHLVRPLPVLIPTYHGLKTGRALFRLALIINDMVGFDRNSLAGGDGIIPRSRILTPDETLALFGGFDRNRLTGGALWYDAQLVDSERLTLSCLLSAAERGAVLANYTEATELLSAGSRVRGVRVRDRAGSGDFVEVRARTVLNTTGPWSPFLFPATAMAAPVLHRGLALGINLVTRGNQLQVAIGFRSKRADRGLVGGDRRYLFATPWRDATLFGTYYTVHSGVPDDMNVAQANLADFVDELNEACPFLELSLKDVSAYHAGLLPRRGMGLGPSELTLAPRHRIVDHSRTGGPIGLITVRSVKYTFARRVAQEAIDRVFAAMDRKVPRCLTGELPVWGGESAVTDSSSRAGDASSASKKLASVYGSRWPEVANACPEDRDWTEAIGDDESSPLRCQVLWAVRKEMALRLPDVVFRRTQMGAVACPTPALLKAVARIMGEELRWDENRRAAEVKDVVRSYLPLEYGPSS